MSPRGPYAELLNALRSGDPVVIVTWHDEAELAEYRELTELWLSAEHEVKEVSALPEAMAWEGAAIWVATDPTAAMDALSARRDALRDREAPIVLFIFHRDENIRHLRDRLDLASWVRGNLVEPWTLSQVDFPGRREAFEAEHHQPPERWLAGWRSGAFPDDEHHTQIFFEALGLERP
jgi:hypothetical protein